MRKRHHGHPWKQRSWHPSRNLVDLVLSRQGCMRLQGEGTGETWITAPLAQVQEQSKPCQKAPGGVSCSAVHTAAWKRLRNLEINMGKNRIQSPSPGTLYREAVVT